MGYFFTLVFIIFLYVRPQEFWDVLLNFPVMDILAGGGLICVFLEGSFDKAKFNNSPIAKVVVIMWLWFAFTEIPTGWLGGVTYVLRKFSPTAILFYLLVLTVTNLSRLRILLWTLILVTTFLSIDAIVQFYTGVSLVGTVALQRHVGEGEFVTQAKGIGIFADPNDLALHVVPMLAFLLPPFYKKSIGNNVVFAVLLLIPLVTGVVYTRSRGGIMAMAFVAWIYLRHRVGLTFSVVGLVLLFGLLAAIPRFGDTSASAGSAQSRLDHWAYGIQLFRSSPIWGVGWDMFRADGYRHTAHNSFVLVMAETGLVGCMMWVSMFYLAGKHIFRMQRITRGPPWISPMSKALEAAMGGWMVGGFFLSQSYSFLLYILMAIVVATVNILSKLGFDISIAWTGRDTRNVFFITMGMIIFIHLLAKTLFVVGG
ncbi:MAG: O-antigen ligase family protein [Desulfarculaceae bacterium]|nr:O-antigen ligase family protein [Desulfarculaceae bacterium]MCF8046000.1 O-antigen ligase family protein [Desulfarculaceae bacterium]MCF8097663.1 O-antigen ligase family protein [Desulfarculaceae bacterium]MCF8123076.1 O-antigen ligase family protein [Desulfarculaceae bacterium]